MAPIPLAIRKAVYRILPRGPLSDERCARIAQRFGISVRSVRRLHRFRDADHDPLRAWIRQRKNVPPTPEIITEIYRRALEIREQATYE